MKRVLEVVLKIYAMKFPIEKGKSRIIEAFSKLVHLNREEVCVTKFGARMLLDLSQFVQRQIYFRGIYEEHILAQMEQLNEKYHFNFMVDVGANVGLHSLFAAIQLNIPNVKAFEPDKQTYSRLKKNLEMNAIESQVTALNFALSDAESEIVMMRPNKSNDGGNYIAERSKGSDTHEVTKAILLDDFLVEFEHASAGMMKIDVEGAEAKVIRGARKLIESGVIKVIFVELCDKHLKRFGDTSAELVRLIESYGMNGFIIEKDCLRRINREAIPNFCEAVFVFK